MFLVWTFCFFLHSSQFLIFVPEVFKVVTGRFFSFSFSFLFLCFCVVVALKRWIDGWMVGDEYGFLRMLNDVVGSWRAGLRAECVDVEKLSVWFF